MQTGLFSSTNLRYLEPGTLIKFAAPQGKYFLPNGNLTSSADEKTREFIWVKASLILGDGSYGGQGLLPDGTGPVILTQNVPTGAVAKEIIPPFDTTFTYALQTDVVNLCLAKRNFGLSFSESTRTWYIINDTDLDIISPYSITFQQDVSNTNKDASWLFAFVWNGIGYEVKYRITDYVFESEKDTSFYFDKSTKNYDFTKGILVRDQIKILGTNPSPVNYGTAIVSLAGTNTNGSVTGFTISNKGKGYVSTPSITVSGGINGSFYPVLKNGSIDSILIVNSGSGYNTATSAVSIDFSETQYSTLPLGSDQNWQIDSAVVEADGYINPKKVLISFLDEYEDSQIENPDSFTDVVAPFGISPQTGYKDKFVYFKKSMDGLTYSIIDDSEILAYPTELDVPASVKIEGQLFYFYDQTVDVVKSYSTTSASYFVLEPDYFAKPGRKGLKFQYKHNSGDDRRLDPSKTNIIDIFILTQSYDTAFRNWIETGSGTEPTPPTSSELEENYSSTLEDIKAISDQIIYQPVKYKSLFGNSADKNLQAVFKAVRNSERSTTDNELKSKILTAIESFFMLDNWDFGKTFYFSELSTYVMNLLTPDITNFIIVPKADVPFGSLYEIACQNNEIFINGATVNDIEIIDAITAGQIKTTETVVNNTLGVY